MSILRTEAVTRLTSLSRATIWRLQRTGQFPVRLRLGANSVGWREEEVRAWLDERPRGTSTPDASADLQGLTPRQRLGASRTSTR